MGRWKCGRIVKWQSQRGGRVVRWQVGKGGRVVKWQGRKGGRVVRWQGGRFLVMLIASAKSQSTRGASHQPAFMSSHLTISHSCLSCLPSGRNLFRSDLFVAGRVVSWKRWEGSELRRWQRLEGSTPPR